MNLVVSKVWTDPHILSALCPIYYYISISVDLEKIIFMETAIKRFVGKVLPDGHLSLPDDTAKEVGNVYEVVLIPIGELDAYSYAASLAKEKRICRLN